MVQTSGAALAAARENAASESITMFRDSAGHFLAATDQRGRVKSLASRERQRAVSVIASVFRTSDACRQIGCTHFESILLQPSRRNRE